MERINKYIYIYIIKTFRIKNEITCPSLLLLWVSDYMTPQKYVSDLLNTHMRSISALAQMVKRLPAMREIRVQSLGWEDLLEKETATHSSILAWKIPGTEASGRLQSMGSQRVGHDWATSLHFTSSKQSSSHFLAKISHKTQLLK